MSRILVGGQAVLEGVMMRAPGVMCIAVRRKNGSIAVYKNIRHDSLKRFALLKKPFIRGFLALIQALVLGIKALNYSSAVALEDMEDKSSETESDPPESESFSLEMPQNSIWMMIFVIVGSFLGGFAVFFFLPLYITNFAGSISPYIMEHGLVFNLIDGIIRVIFFLLYILGISFVPDIKRIFEYHGAEHKSIFAYEAGHPLTVEHARIFPTLHPRCGTAFIMVVMFVAVLVFSLIPMHVALWVKALSRLFLLPVIAGISFEIIRKAGEGTSPLFSWFVKPGLWLQRITTREPDDEQLEVGLKALQVALSETKHNDFDMVV